MTEFREKKAKWVFVVPIANLELTAAVNFEYRISRVTFVDATHLARRRKRFGLPVALGELRNRPHSVLKAFFANATTFAIVRYTGKLADVEHRALAVIREELALLTLSQLGYSKRKTMGAPAISQENPTAKRRYLVMHTGEESWIETNSLVGRYHRLTLDERWEEFQQESFFPGLLRILRGSAKIGKSWATDLRNAALLIGQSQASSDVPQAFLWNMIALELLLTQQGDTYSDALPRRAEAFLGWVSHWTAEAFSERITDIYKKRSAFVHAGERDAIAAADLFFTDDLVLNLLLNIVTHLKRFPSKSAIIDFSRRVEAERLLGIKPRVRPKTLKYWSRQYGKADFDL